MAYDNCLQAAEECKQETKGDLLRMLWQVSIAGGWDGTEGREWDVPAGKGSGVTQVELHCLQLKTQTSSTLRTGM